MSDIQQDIEVLRFGATDPLSANGIALGPLQCACILAHIDAQQKRIVELQGELIERSTQLGFARHDWLDLKQTFDALERERDELQAECAALRSQVAG